MAWNEKYFVVAGAFLFVAWSCTAAFVLFRENCDASETKLFLISSVISFGLLISTATNRTPAILHAPFAETAFLLLAMAAYSIHRDQRSSIVSTVIAVVTMALSCPVFAEYADNHPGSLADQFYTAFTVVAPCIVGAFTMTIWQLTFRTLAACRQLTPVD